MIREAAGDVLAEVLRESWAIWADGLSLPDYTRYNQAQMQTAWGRTHLHRLVELEDGRLGSSAKRYRLRARLNEEIVGVLGIGAVFTPPERRGRGAASRLIAAMIEEARAEGAAAAVLFSEIGAAFYERFGFVAIPREEVLVEAESKPGAPAILTRAGEDRDIPAAADLLRTIATRYRFALWHDDDYVRFGLARKRLLAGFTRTGLRTVEFYVAEEGASAVAFVVLTSSIGGTMLEACGDRDPSGARVGAILQVLRARRPSEPAPRIRAWLPAGFAPPQMRVLAKRTVPELLMIKSLRADFDPRTLAPHHILFWHGDAF